MENARLKAKSEKLEHKTEEELQAIRKEARQKLKEVQQEAEARREKEMEERAEAYIAEGRLPAGKTLNIIIEQEKIRKEYSDIQRELERKKFNALTRLIVPGEKYVDANGQEQERPGLMYTDRDTIHKLLINRSIKHFSQAEDTP